VCPWPSTSLPARPSSWRRRVLGAPNGIPAFYTRESKNTWSATVARRSWSTLAATCRTEDIGVDRMEIVGAGDRVVVGLPGPRFRETEWPPLKGQIFIVFTVRGSRRPDRPHGRLPHPRRAHPMGPREGEIPYPIWDPMACLLVSGRRGVRTSPSAPSRPGPRSKSDSACCLRDGWSWT
jgi:hypothetical protein